MDVKCRGAFLLLVVAAAASTFGVASANKEWSTVAGNWNHTGADFWWQRHPNGTQAASKRLIVGGDQNWRFGFNYTNWAINNAPFFLNDTLVFKYDPPNDTTFPHSVYLLPDFWSFQNCDLRRARKIGDVNAGGGDGFEFVLKRWQPYYFACGQHDGIHCKDGLMKFAVWPLIRWFY
ncbi:hypothetical protein SASPL_104535 [Salvia splendens]|uniref:Phytocyanin domain-containing protein n=1 Tax=Salvia splendens TaxID=180675 RepID=A0A8X9A9X2_SALSN|nr:blue copper protein 1b-like [Salvia splendens]KAG6432941.1 hypothetical protein SASPL_104535 [Salvia splendens]